ncbi:hypothetical protein ACKRZS_004032 [Fusarium odoratissimum]|uniref:Uncharacterized protein n=1 Tax=Fusarium oxysporum f. sp. cubense TaxID=61366 RepID=A0A5C6SBU3_FUSOC|nr:hypothetical protein FocTR4_00015859 [Fusarium oxysporum f. sp. cubense]
MKVATITSLLLGALPVFASLAAVGDSTNTVKDLSLTVVEQNSTYVCWTYDYQPGVDLASAADVAILVRRANIRWPGVSERVSVALEDAKVTIIRLAANEIKVIIDNLTQHVINVLFGWELGDVDDQAPAGATSSTTQRIHQGTSQSISVNAYLAD